MSLFSGGKDSSWALYRALETGRNVERLVTVHPPDDSFMFHAPATELATLAARSIGIPLVDVHLTDADPGPVTDVGGQGDREIEPVEAALRDLAPELGGIDGLVAGAVASEYQTSRIRTMADRLGADLFTPLWREDPAAIADRMLADGFDVLVVAVAAEGLDESWLGRRLDRAAFGELKRLKREYGVHLLGEGGEFETLVTDAPHMDRPIDLTAETVWLGDRGTLRITDARLGGRE